VPLASFRTLRRFVADAVKHKRQLKQIDYVAAFCQGNMRGRVFVRLPDCLAEHLIYKNISIVPCSSSVAYMA
ncbi:MAG: hypothetical protein ACREOZ_01865, partial [Gloeomargaritales cyanobacterium]